MYRPHTSDSLFTKLQSDIPGAVKRRRLSVGKSGLPNQLVMSDDDANSKRYLERAAELREFAAQVQDPATRDTLIKAAEAYERLANWKSPKNGKPEDSP